MLKIVKASICLSMGSLLVCSTGCHSAFIQATVTNDADRPVRVFEVDYPSAGFGGSALAPGASFHYRFKLQGDGPIKVTWTDGHDREHTDTGPTLQEGQEGTLVLHFASQTTTWTSALHRVP